MTNSEFSASKKRQKTSKRTKTASAPKAPTLLVGIDLGTSRTAIASSNGHRLGVSTYVGKPKDEVSEKLFGKRLLFGDEALYNRMSLDLLRPLKDGVIQTASGTANEHVDAVQALLAHVVSLVSPLDNDVVYGVIGMPARASISNKKLLIDAVRDVFDAVMVVSEPFAVAYGLDILTDALIIDIGAGTMDLCRMHGSFPTEDDQATVSKAGDFIDQTLSDLIRQRYPRAQFTLNMIKAIKELHGYVSDKEERIEVEFTVEGRPRMFDITAELKRACLGIVSDLTKAIYRLVGSFDPEFQKRLRDNVVVCGGGSQMTGLRMLIEKALDELGGGRARIVDEPVYAGANGALKIANDMPDSFWEHLRD
ncbi:MAG TPA: hypothetical protein HPP77_10880 [Candidatus Hydrogenedentes bacterium]|nr:hypothetical protein [Candidatus Hydrogenedentota bacterium]HIJ73739.1 hypothetical protein [Candidatus Hydrogenedentota bacterium]